MDGSVHAAKQQDYRKCGVHRAPDPSRITSHIAKAISMALLPNLKQLKAENLSPLAVKVCLDPENVRSHLVINDTYAANYK